MVSLTSRWDVGAHRFFLLFVCFFSLSLFLFSQTRIQHENEASFIESQTHSECSGERYPSLRRTRDLYNCTGCLGQGAGRYVCSILRISDRCTLFRGSSGSRVHLRDRRPAAHAAPLASLSLAVAASRSIASPRREVISRTHEASEGSYKSHSSEREIRRFANSSVRKSRIRPELCARTFNVRSRSIGVVTLRSPDTPSKEDQAHLTTTSIRIRSKKKNKGIIAPI